MNNFIKEAADSKRTYFSILCTGDTLASQLAWSPSDQTVQFQGLAQDIVLCFETRITTGLMSHLASIQTSPFSVLEVAGLNNISFVLLFQVFIVPHLVKLITLIHVKMVHIAQVAHLYRTQLNVPLGFSAPLVVPYPNHVLQEHSPTLQGGTAVTLVLLASTASLWSSQEMNPWDTVSVQGGTTVLRGLVLIGVHAQQVPTVIVSACTVRSSARTVMLESSVMEET